MSTNMMRAEKTLTIENKDYKAKMTLDTIMRIEDSLDTSIFAIAKKFEEPSVRMRDICQILLCSIRSGGNDIKDDVVYRHVSDVGIVQATKTAGELIVLGLNIQTNSPEEEKKSNP